MTEGREVRYGTITLYYIEPWYYRLPVVGKWLRRRQLRGMLGHTIEIDGKRHTIAEYTPLLPSDDWAKPPTISGNSL